MADFKFTETAVPEQVFTKVTEPNPFGDKVAALAASVDDDGTSVTAATVVVPDDEVSKRVGQIRKAGEAAGVTARKKLAPQDDGTTAITFWTTKRIVRPRKDAADK